jgi:hypothetical protein
MLLAVSGYFKKAFIFGVGADPKPDHIVLISDRNSAVVQVDSS